MSKFPAKRRKMTRRSKLRTRILVLMEPKRAWSWGLLVRRRLLLQMNRQPKRTNRLLARKLILFKTARRSSAPPMSTPPSCAAQS